MVVAARSAPPSGQRAKFLDLIERDGLTGSGGAIACSGRRIMLNSTSSYETRNAKIVGDIENPKSAAERCGVCRRLIRPSPRRNRTSSSATVCQRNRVRVLVASGPPRARQATSPSKQPSGPATHQSAVKPPEFMKDGRRVNECAARFAKCFGGATGNRRANAQGQPRAFAACIFRDYCFTISGTTVVGGDRPWSARCGF
jgi:hypothetical protein